MQALKLSLPKHKQVGLWYMNRYSILLYDPTIHVTVYVPCTGRNMVRLNLRSQDIICFMMFVTYTCYWGHSSHPNLCLGYRSEMSLAFPQSCFYSVKQIHCIVETFLPTKATPFITYTAFMYLT